MTKSYLGWGSATLLSATLLLTALPLAALAQPADSEASTRSDNADAPRVIEARLQGDQTVEYPVSATQGQILSVNLDASLDSVHFNIQSADGAEFLFAGMMTGNVADIAVPDTGDYLVQVFLGHAAARRDEQASYTLTIGVAEPDDVEAPAEKALTTKTQTTQANDTPTKSTENTETPTGSASEGGALEDDTVKDSAQETDPESGPTDAPDSREGPAYWQVNLEDPTGRLNVRSEPGQEHVILGQFGQGETLANLGCRTSGSTRWCLVRAASSDANIRGWVAERFLAEGSEPVTPDHDTESADSNDQTFDAQGKLDCVLGYGEPARSCSFEVTRDGPGNADLRITAPSSQGSKDAVRILFEMGMVTSVGNGEDRGADFVSRKTQGRYEIETGSRRFIVPVALVNDDADNAADAADTSAREEDGANDASDGD